MWLTFVLAYFRWHNQSHIYLPFSIFFCLALSECIFNVIYCWYYRCNSTLYAFRLIQSNNFMFIEVYLQPLFFLPCSILVVTVVASICFFRFTRRFGFFFLLLLFSIDPFFVDVFMCFLMFRLSWKACGDKIVNAVHSL